jgi:hypothetical protein
LPDSDAQLAAQNAALTRQLLEWIGGTARTYAETVEVWRSTCPRHSIWEDALAAGLIDCDSAGVLRLTSQGTAALATLRSA